MRSIKVESLGKQPLGKTFNDGSTQAAVSKQFRALILILSATSPYGILVKTSDEKVNVTYEAPKLSWKQPLSIYSVLLLFWIIFCFCIQIFNTALNIPFPIHLTTLTPSKNISEENTFMLKWNLVGFFFTSSCRILEFVGAVLSAPLLVKWLNELTAIETDFNTHFSRIGVLNFLIIFYFILPGIFWIAANCWAFLPQYNFNPKYNALGYIWYFTTLFYLIVPELLEDVKMILMLEVLKRMYSQVRNAISQEVRHAETKTKCVVTWDALITKLRRHVKLTGKCIKTQQMLNICETIFAVSVGTYLVIRSAGGDNAEGNFGFAIISGFYCVFMASRLYFKVAIAESIYAEERLLIDDLKDYELHLSAESSEILPELRNLQQSLMLAPCKVPIGSCCDLDSKLLVQVVIQVIPMLIAVAQFHT